MSEWNDESVRDLRGAVARSDAALVLRLLHGCLRTELLQLSGDGLLDALRKGEPGASDLAAECVVALRDRDWEGDEELAEQLDAVSGRGPTPLLRPLAVDLGDVALAMDFADRGAIRIDRKTGQQEVLESDYVSFGGA